MKMAPNLFHGVHSCGKWVLYACCRGALYVEMCIPFANRKTKRNYDVFNFIWFFEQIIIPAYSCCDTFLKFKFADHSVISE